ncbi:MAG: TonB-dependent receptor [Vicinamibacterales bacterium]
MWAALCVLSTAPAFAQRPASPSPRGQAAAATIRVSGTIRDENNGISLPGIAVELVGTDRVVYTDVDGRYVIDLPPGRHELRVTMDAYETKTIAVEVGEQRNVNVDVGLGMSRFTETVNVVGQAIDVQTSTAEAQLLERKTAQVIEDNMGSQEMRRNGDNNAGAAMSRVTGLSLVDNQYVYVRGLGERYSNTTLSGALLPTTEPDKKVVPLDMFPSGLIDSVQVAKSYTPDKSAEFAGGLVQIVPLKLPTQTVFDVSYGFSHVSTATGQTIPMSTIGRADWLGYDRGLRALPDAFPDSKIVRSGIYTPDTGYTFDEMAAFGRLLGNQWRPQDVKGKLGQNWNAVFGRRFNKLGIIASASHQYRELFVNEQRRFFRIGDGELEAVSDYNMEYGTQRAQLGAVGNVSYQFNTNNRISVENFYSHTGRDEGRRFQGPNTENLFLYRNYRLQFIEEGMLSNVTTGEHFLRGLGNSRIDWRASLSRAKRNEPDLREVLYQSPLPPATERFVLADESQSGFRMFNKLNDKTIDSAGNWSIFSTKGNHPAQYKIGGAFVKRTRDFTSRRFRFIPITLTKDGPTLFGDTTAAPEDIYTSSNIGTAFRFNEETRPTDAYDGNQTTASAYGMVDLALSATTRLVAGARVERFNQEVNTFDPFGLFVGRQTAQNKNTDLFPAVNIVKAVRPNMNLRASYSSTVNRPEFRELAAFEFTDVVGSRAIRGNPNLKRALIQNVDGRWETFLGTRGILAASAFYKHFDQPIERIVIAGAQPLVTFQNSDHARNFGAELEAGHEISRFFFASVNYTYFDSKIALLPSQQAVQTSLVRPLAGQSRNIVNVMGEFNFKGFTTRMLLNRFGDRISDVGSNDAPDVIEQGRVTLDIVVSQRIGRGTVRLNGNNLNNPQYLFTQGDQTQRSFKMGRVLSLSFTFGLF